MIHKTPTRFMPSPQLSYVLGVIFQSEKKKVGCDGFAYSFMDKEGTKRYYVKLSVKDLDFAEEFKTNLCRVLERPNLLNVYTNRGVHNVLIGCANFVRWVRALSREDYFSIVSCFPRQFLRGAFDSEGSPIGTIHLRKFCRRAPDFRYEVRIAMCDESFLLFCKKMLELLGIESKLKLSAKKGRISTYGKLNFDYYALVTNDVINFRNLIGFSIARKQQKLNDICTTILNFKCNKTRIEYWTSLYRKERNKWLRK